MEADEVGKLQGGQSVYLARSALSCDAVIPINRVKPHTEFRAPIESGLTKMLTVGLGKLSRCRSYAEVRLKEPGLGGDRVV